VDEQFFHLFVRLFRIETEGALLSGIRITNITKFVNFFLILQGSDEIYRK